MPRCYFSTAGSVICPYLPHRGDRRRTCGHHDAAADPNGLGISRVVEIDTTGGPCFWLETRRTILQQRHWQKTAVGKHPAALHSASSSTDAFARSAASRNLARPTSPRPVRGKLADHLVRSALRAKNWNHAPQGRASLENLVGTSGQWQRNCNAERAGGLHVNVQLDLGYLLDRQIGRFFAVEYASGINACLTMRLRKTACVTHQATRDSEVARLVDRGNGVADS